MSAKSILALLGCLPILAAFAQTQPSPQQEEVELLPDFIVRRIQQDAFENAANQAVDAGQIERGVVEGLKRWDTSTPITVCFFGGKQETRRKIAAAAAQWELPGTTIKFDFGDRNDPRFCSPRDFNQIRVGYTLPGYWSYVGKDSIALADQSEASLNLARFNFGTFSPTEFNRLVLHEFGHALGLRHEHQLASARCDDEFDWPAIYRYLGGPPNNWDPDTIKFNMRSQNYLQGDIVGPFNRQSIMLYSFPIQFYKRGKDSSCYAPTNNILSAGDIALIKRAYAGNIVQQQAAGAARLQAAMPSLAAEQRDAVQSRIRLLSADSRSQAKIIGTVRAEFVDVDVFRCKDNAKTNALADRVARSLANQSNIGRLRVRGELVEDVAATSGREGISVIADPQHPEVGDASTLVDALQADFPGDVRLLENADKASPWYLSVMTCAQ